MQNIRRFGRTSLQIWVDVTGDLLELGSGSRSAAAPQVSSMNQAPDDGAERAQPENARCQRLDAETTPALVGGLRIAGHVESAAGDPEQGDRGCDGIADVDRKQPQRGQEDRQPFQRVHLHPEHPLEVVIARDRRRLDAEFGARLRDPNAGEEIKCDGKAGDECREMIHRDGSLRLIITTVIPGRRAAANPESRNSGFALASAPE